VALEPNGDVTLPQINSTSDCVNRLMHKFNQNPAGLRIHYFAQQDIVSLGIVGLKTIVLRKCH